MADLVATRFVTCADPVEAAARLLADAIRRADHARGSARLAIPGGSALAALAPARVLLPAEVWSRVRLTWIDERCVPESDPESNRGEALRAGALGRPELQLPLYLDGESPEQAVARVEAGLARDFDSGLDVVLLGMGEDGHIASLFPGAPGLRAGGLAAAVTNSPKPPPRRITLTLPLLTGAHAVLLASGAKKRAALERLARGDETLPASRLQRLEVVTDQDLEQQEDER